ncbi:MAG: hypothetical protein LBT09_06820, partial [Planctomycetaceae bacterium]|nr:hypothetical protein [Planctomycetaceae bacterium]
MAIELSLTFIPTAITQPQWDFFWQESLRMLNNFPVRMSRLVDRKTDYGTLRLLSRVLVDSDSHGEFFSFAGDAVSFTLGQEIRVYRDIEYYRKQLKGVDEQVRDPLYCTSESYGSEEDNRKPDLVGVKIFHVNTLGRPYHVAATGLIMFAESVFAGQCVGWHHFRLRECNEMRPWLSDCVNREVQIPICMDASRLWNRVEGVCGDIDLTRRRFVERFVGPDAQKVHRLLAESRENTMRELAEALLNCRSINKPEAIDISESFLEATDNLDMYLDLIDFRNSLAIANNKDPSNNKIELFTLESVLRMLIMNLVTVTKWQCQEMHLFKRWTTMDGDIKNAANMALIRTLAPRVFEFYCSPTDLLDTFYRRDPSAKLQLQAEADKAFKDSKDITEKITSIIREVKAKADEVYQIDDSSLPEPSVQTFPFYVDAETRTLTHALEPLGGNSVIKLAKRLESLYNVKESLNFGVDVDELFSDASGEMQKTVIANTISDYALSVLEDTWNAIVDIKDNELLNTLAFLITVATTKEYEKFEKIII